jgi:nicotinamidase/pyrazinamidase
MKKVLVVVDVQKDFYHPNGALYVEGGELLPERIKKILPEYDKVIFTVDWHPNNHCSFVENGGQWPKHCIAFTEGASLPKEFTDYIEIYEPLTKRFYMNVVSKGSLYNKEEYGVHHNALLTGYNTDEIKTFDVTVVGIHALYCVKETLKELLNANCNSLNVIPECIAPLNNEELIQFCNENNINVISK